MRRAYVDGQEIEEGISIPVEKKILNAVKKMIFFYNRSTDLYVFWRNVYRKYESMETGSALGRTI